jgi:hypothetical protein
MAKIAISVIFTSVTPYLRTSLSNCKGAFADPVAGHNSVVIPASPYFEIPAMFSSLNLILFIHLPFCGFCRWETLIWPGFVQLGNVRLILSGRVTPKYRPIPSSNRSVPRILA